MGRTGADKKRPDYDVELSDGTDTVGLMLINGRGMNDPLAIQRSPYPRTSTKINSGTGKYDDLELPYKSIAQEDWIGGRAGLNFEDDATRYMDNFRAWTDQSKQICNGPQETYCNEYGATYRQNFQSIPGKVNFTALMEANTYLAHKFTTVAGVTVGKVAFILKKVGGPAQSLTYAIYNDDLMFSYPTTVVHTETAIITRTIDSVSEVVELDLSHTLGAATSFWLVISQGSGTPTEADHWEVGTNPDANTDTRKSTNGTNWTMASQELYYRIIDNNIYNFKLFEYKRAVYAVDMKKNSSATIFLNGDRGAADDNTANKTYLNDATKTWTNDEWIGCTVLITKGPGSSDAQPWRTITDNTATALVVSPAWDTTHTTATEYVILGSNKWTYKTSWTSVDGNVFCNDIAVADEFAYVALNNGGIYAYIEHNVNGVWTAEAVTELTAYANKLKAINTPTGWELWGGYNNHSKYGTCVWKAKVPKAYSASAQLYNLESVLDDGKGVWDEQSASNVTVSKGDDGMAVALAAGFTTGLACSNALPATDITKGTKIGMMMKTSVATLAADLDLKLDDTPFCARNYLPDNVWHYDAEVAPSSVIMGRSCQRPTSVMYFDSVEASGAEQWSSVFNLFDGETTYNFTLDWVAADYLYVSYAERFFGVYFALGSADDFQDQASTLSADYYNGHDWQALTIVGDGTIKTATKTMSQSGYVYWTIPTNWNLGCDYAEASYLASDRYHIRFKVNNPLKAGLIINRLLCYGNGLTEAPSANQFLDMKSVYDNIIDSGLSFTLYNQSSIYVRYNKRFNRIKFDLGTAVNTKVATLAGYFWNGINWASASITDGTLDIATSTKTLNKDGDITFTMPTEWQPGCPTYLETYLSATDYVIKLVVTTDATIVSNPYLDVVTFNKITLEDDSLNDVFRWTVLNNVKDGDTNTYDYLTLTTDDYAYVMFSSKFNKVYWTLSVVNAVDTTMVAQYFNGNAWTSLTITDGTATSGNTMHQSGAMSFTIPHDWQPVEIGQESGYAVRFYPSADLTPNVKITELYVQNDDALTVSIPAMAVANQWYYHEVAITPNANPNPDESKIISIGLYIATDNGAQTITIGSIDLITEALDYFKLGNDRINSIEAYGDTVTNPWVFTESMIYEVQTQNDNAVVPIPLREITALRSEINGQAHTVSDVYLVFNLGQYIQKYYQHNLDDVGPNRDEGLPSDRQGDPTCLLSFPGRIFLSLDAKTTGYSTILLRREGGWHELYRAPYGCPIHDMIIQVVPGKSTRLWFSQEYDILWLPLPTDTWNPKNDSDFRFTHESVITTGWITAGLMDVLKFWKSMKIYSENLSGTSQYIQCEYQTETGELNSGWTAIEDTFDTSPFQEELIDDDYDINARRIRFRFKLITSSNLECPIMKASVIEALLRFPVKYSYGFTFVLEDEPANYSGTHNSTKRAEDDAVILDAWADAPTVLTMRCLYSPYDDKKVVLEPISYKPLELDANDRLFEKHVGSATVLEV